MAQMDTGGGDDKGGKVRSKKADTRIDFTPMVDLGFLLITFFMLTTTLAKPTIMPLIFPEKKDLKLDDLEPVKESKVMTLLLGEKDKVYYYNGISDAQLDSTDYSAEGLRKVLLDKKKSVAALFPEVEKIDTLNSGEVRTRMMSELNVIIKPMKGSRYKNVVDAFDEMAITKVTRYVLLDVSDAERDFVADPSKGLNFSTADQVESSSN